MRSTSCRKKYRFVGRFDENKLFLKTERLTGLRVQLCFLFDKVKVVICFRVGELVSTIQALPIEAGFHRLEKALAKRL